MAKPTKGIHRDVTTGEALIIGPRGEEIRFTNTGLIPRVGVVEDSIAAGAIASKSGLVLLSTASGTRTLADPVAGADDGKILNFICLLAATGAVVAAAYADGTNLECAFTTGEALSLVAYGGEWYVLSTTGTLSAGP